jgi:hypothetical protein
VKVLGRGDLTRLVGRAASGPLAALLESILADDEFIADPVDPAAKLWQCALVQHDTAADARRHRTIRS